RLAVPDTRDGEGLGEQVPIRLDDGEQQDDEAPEDKEVGDPRDRTAQQLALGEHIEKFGLELRRPMTHPTGCRPAGRHQAVKEPPPPNDHGEPDDGYRQADCNSESHEPPTLARHLYRVPNPPECRSRNEYTSVRSTPGWGLKTTVSVGKPETKW